MAIRAKTKQQVDRLIQSQTQPKVPRSGIGLVLPDGRGRKILVNHAGALTPAGKYYYEQVGTEAPSKFDFAQQPERAGRSLMIKLLDGSKRAVSRFDPVAKEFKPTALGRKFYANRKDRYTVLFPVSVDLTRKNGSIYTREGDWMPSTATDLGEVEVSAALSELEQTAEVKRQAQAWMDAQPMVSGERILMPGYETHRLDPARELQFNRMSFNAAGEASAVMHRPLTAGACLWSFDFPGVCEEASQDTNDQCVPHQLSKYIRIKGGEAPFTKEQLAEELRLASLDIYEDTEDDDLLDCPGFTAAAVRRLCESHGIPFHVRWGQHKIENYTPEQSKYEHLAVIIWGDHLYTVGDPATRAAITKEQQSAPDVKDWVLGAVARSEPKSPGFGEWELFSGLAPGSWYTRDIAAVRAALHGAHVCPHVRKNGMNQVKSLHYNDCHVHAIPREAEVCFRFLQELAKTRPHSVVYRGESFAGFCQLVFDSLNTVDARQAPTFLERQAVLHRCGGLCEMCGDPVAENLQLDHHVPRSCFGKDALGNLKGLCPACHKFKTSTCDSQRIAVEDANPYLSRFNEATWKAFVESRRPHQVVADLHEPTNGPLWHCDVRSCRFHALTECNAHEIPVFSPMDEITEVEGYHLSDYHWVEIPPGQLRSPLQTYAYDGARWYSKAECQFLLDHGICKWSDLKLAFQATAHRPAKELATQLRFMRQLWEETGASFAGEAWAGERKSRARTLLSKSAMLACIGAWGRTTNHRYTTITTSHPDDCAFEGQVLTSQTPGSSVFHDITYRQHVRGYGTYLPLNLVARSLERLNVARAILICLKHMRVERLLAIQVDCLVFQPPRKVARRACEELQDMTYGKLHLATRHPLRRYVGPLQDPIKSKETVYQLKKLDEPLKVGGELKRQDGERPVVEALQWTIRTEPATGADAFAEEVIQHVLTSSACVVGPPGTGKSHLLTQLRTRLREAAETVEVLAPTNAAARIVEGCTIHNFLTRYARNGRGFQGVLLIDEVSMLSMALTAVLDNLRASGCRIVSFGDWDQLPPVGNSWRGEAVDPLILRDSALLKRWSDCTLFRLTRCRRSDEAHFNFYTQLHEDLPTAIAWARAAYKSTHSAGMRRAERGGLHLVISHRKRRTINAERQNAVAEGLAGVQVPAHDGEPEYVCVPGTPLVGSCTGRGFVNGAFYEVREVHGNVHLVDKLTDDVLECSPEVLAKHTCLAHAVVYNRAQGLTIKEQTVILHSLDSKYFRRPHLYVGLSRVTSGANIRIAP